MPAAARAAGCKFLFRLASLVLSACWAQRITSLSTRRAAAGRLDFGTATGGTESGRSFLASTRTFLNRETRIGDVVAETSRFADNQSAGRAFY